MADAAPTPEGALLRAEAQDQLRLEVAGLPGHYRPIIELRHYRDLSYQEIADELGVPLSDVKSWRFRARKRLCQQLNGVHEILGLDSLAIAWYIMSCWTSTRLTSEYPVPCMTSRYSRRC